MSLTVAGTHAVIVERVGGRMTLAKLSVAPDSNGLVPKLSGPCRDALAYLGLVPADPAAVADADLARVPPGRAKVYFDAATLEALYVIQGNLSFAFDQKVEAEQQMLHQLEEDLETLIAQYLSRVPKLNVMRTGVGQPPCRPIPNDANLPPVSYHPGGWPYRTAPPFPVLP